MARWEGDEKGTKLNGKPPVKWRFFLFKNSCAYRGKLHVKWGFSISFDELLSLRFSPRFKKLFLEVTQINSKVYQLLKLDIFRKRPNKLATR